MTTTALSPNAQECVIVISGNRRCRIETTHFENGVPLCIFHAEQKDAGLFMAKLREKIDRETADDAVGEIDLSRFVFPPVYFSGISFTKSVTLRKAKFTGYASFSGCHLTCKVFEFSDVQVKDGIDFSTTRFESEVVDFRGTSFEGEIVNFENAIIKAGDIDFSDANFYGRKNKFTKAKISSRTTINFSNCNFGGSLVDFTLAAMDGAQVIFALSTFSSTKTLFSQCSLKAKYLNFRSTLWSSKFVTFVAAQFITDNGAIAFNESRFSLGDDGAIVWNHALFECGNLEFMDVIFKGDYLYFVQTEFRAKLTLFSRAKFCSLETVFDSAIFEGLETYFQQVKFFGNRTEFNNTFFNTHTTVFDESVCKGRVLFKGSVLETGDIKPVPSPLSMKNIEVEQEQFLLFKHMDLSQTEFKGTDLRKLEFVDVQWCKIVTKTFFIFQASRNGIFEEILYQKTADILAKQTKDAKYGVRLDRSDRELLRRAYRQLKQSHDDSKNYSGAGDFYYGEMEQQRLMLPSYRRNFFSWEMWYRLASGYGQRWGVSLSWILFFFLAFPLLFLVTGIRVVFYPLSSCWAYLVAGFEVYSQAIQFNFWYVTLQRDFVAQFEPEVLTRKLASLETFLLTLLGALFILALRRRFKR